MKFTEMWGEVLIQNNTLKITTILVSLVAFSVALVATKYANRDPIVIERGCYSKVVPNSSVETTNQEIESFIKEALSSRFDSDVNPNFALLAEGEAHSRIQEQKELQQKNLSQKIIFRSLKVASNKVTVESDRVLAVGQVRSALPFPLEIDLSTTSRSISNPYGLTLNSVKERAKEVKL